MTSTDALASHENRLARESSPYLLQHKHNPVDWWPWGTEALAEARRTSKPILLSVGYAACHWCHVMAHESFEDDATARVMNDLFVNVKVDREERPDIDQIYMAALHHRTVIGAAELERAANQIAGMIDPVHGGMRGAPKFPQPAMLEFLWRAGQRMRDRRYFGAVELSLGRMCEGGIYDHLGGGFSRYSVDERWLTPHFEKMLYDNAQLLELLALAWQRSGNELFRERARETVGWLAREMTTREGAFCASLDADSEGEEGKFYVWSLAEIESVLGREAAAFCAAHYDVTPQGNFEGHNILNRLKHVTRSSEEEQRLAILHLRRVTLDHVVGMAVGEKQIDGAVVVVVEELQPPSAQDPRGSRDVVLIRDVGKELLPLIVVEREHLLIDVRDEQILASVGVDVR